VRIQVVTPGVRPMNEAMDAAFRVLGCEPLGGPSEDGWSKMLDFQRCPYRYYLMHEVKMFPSGEAGDRSPLALGGLTHAALALHYCRMLPEGYPGWRKDPPPPLDFLDAVEAAGGDIVLVHAARRFYGSYAEHYVNETITPVAVEMPFGKVGDHTCRFDLLAWRDGALWNYEHKTAANETEDVIEGWWLDGEILGEVYAARKGEIEKLFGAPLAGVCINLIVKTHPVRFRRLDIVITDKVLASFARDRAFWAAERDRYRQLGHWPRAHHGCLGRYNDACLFWHHCRDEDHSLLQIRRAA
jgi:hypothetical protein